MICQLSSRHLRYTDVDAYDEILAPDYKHLRGRGATDWNGPEAFKSNVRRILEGVTGADTTSQIMLGDGDPVAVAWTSDLTHGGAFFGAPPTGITATWETTDVFRIACGRIAETWTNSDVFGLPRQFGIITDAELATVEMPSPGTVTP
jgi:predicted ester cyclase